MNTASSRYTAMAIVLHWLMAFLLIGLFCVGIYMSDLQLSPWKLKIYSWHKWAGVTAFILVLVRLAWRFIHHPPELPSATSRPMCFAAHVSHVLLYLLMLVIPISGWLMSSAKGFQTVYLGVLPIPDVLEKNKELGHFLQDVHQNLNFLFIGLVVAHLCAAIKHHLIDKDDVLTRMWPLHVR